MRNQTKQQIVPDTIIATLGAHVHVLVTFYQSSVTATEFFAHNYLMLLSKLATNNHCFQIRLKYTIFVYSKKQRSMTMKANRAPKQHQTLMLQRRPPPRIHQPTAAAYFTSKAIFCLKLPLGAAIISSRTTCLCGFLPLSSAARMYVCLLLARFVNISSNSHLVAVALHYHRRCCLPSRSSKSAVVFVALLLFW